MSQCFYFNERSTSKLFILLMIRRLPISTLFPCTTLVRSPQSGALGLAELGRCPRSSQCTLSPWPCGSPGRAPVPRSAEDTSELQSRQYLVCRLLLEKKKKPYRSFI